MKTVLQTDKIGKNFGGLRALDAVDLNIQEGEIVALIGPNGAGKTTLFNCITGMHEPTDGKVNIIPPGKGKTCVNGFKPNIITELGLARTFQNIRLFSKMTVLENVMVGCHCRNKNTFLEAIIKGPRFKREEKQTLAHSLDLLETFGLVDFAQQMAENLPYADQRRLEIARALATDPFLLLLDEPAAGMNPNETNALDQLILKIRTEKKISILLIEHDMKLVMRISDRIFVMNQGKNIADGSPQEIRNNETVIHAYLGEE
ncbi:MAG: ABC transporter ATP-binding protein [Deltaproteobacteria bacterium]|jgi:branched-chain amino acid transport system ATP-binding protein|nr:ABC transporter ATP-binding protein [Deltaproteobacteria bacterium]MBT4268094.1 ABC transporter ATP-binding protein [Deltaproteobacteria bacterium]MBT4640277.1 ABC transporter ATP-binding protein [Deltaproteobacteria bacterium]MBT6502973.1 ABC transporter ATP-binding protein [Deltaproteobacteria bacterium]MBT6616566.1 ABC transporter ATP-binding protein [Deltaproteobacteria bacterium]